jgi:TonB family protein
MNAWAEGMVLWSWQSLLLIILIAIITRAHRSSSAADRHFYWLIGLIVVAILPAANVVVHALPAQVVVGPAVSLSNVMRLPAAGNAVTVQAERSFAWADFILPLCFAVWVLGFLLNVTRVSRDYWLLQQNRSQGRRAKPGTFPVSVIYSGRVQTPVLAGFLRPEILLPENIEQWTSAEERQAILLHEMAHLQRRDHWVSLFSALLGSVFSFHPAIRYALRQLLVERELACDEHVLASGTSPATYTEVILKVAERNISGRQTDCPALNAAGKALERRVNMILNYRFSGENRFQIPAIARSAIIVALATLLLPQRAVTAEIQSRAPVPVPVPAQVVEAQPVVETASVVAVPLLVPKTQAPPVQASAPPVVVQGPAGQVSGRVMDQTGALVRGVSVVLSGGATSQSTITNISGSFEFAQVPPGQYSIRARVPDFRPNESSVIVRDSQTSRVGIFLSVSGIETVLDVQASKPATPPAAETPTTLPQRIGGDVAQANLVSAPKPVYPPRARAYGIQGVVKLLGVIGANGTVLAVVPDPTSTADPELVQAAIDAVKQWRYKPHLLNQQPIDIATTITVNFALVD